MTFFNTFNGNALKKFVNMYNNRTVYRLKLRYNFIFYCKFSKLGKKTITQEGNNRTML